MTVVEVGKRRTFASVLAWPGWSRAGRDENSALVALEEYQDRYGAVLRAVGLKGPPAGAFVVTEHLPGDATTEFGAPGKAAVSEEAPFTPAESKARCERLSACWAALERAAATAPAILQKGPRGGGRDRDAIVAHVLAAEVAYGRKIGLPGSLEREERRVAMLETLAGRHPAGPLTERGWSARYALRRIAWHALDHAWEIADKS